MRWSLPLLALLSELAADETLTLDVELPAPVAPDGLAACSLDVQIRAGHTQTITLRTTSSFHMALAAAERFARAHNLTHGHGCETCACVAHVLVEVIAEQCPSICAHARCDELRALEASDKKLLVAYGNCQASAIATAVRRVGGAAFDAEWDVHVITPVQSVSRAELRASGALAQRADAFVFVPVREDYRNRIMPGEARVGTAWWLARLGERCVALCFPSMRFSVYNPEHNLQLDCPVTQSFGYRDGASGHIVLDGEILHFPAIDEHLWRIWDGARAAGSVRPSADAYARAWSNVSADRARGLDDLFEATVAELERREAAGAALSTGAGRQVVALRVASVVREEWKEARLFVHAVHAAFALRARVAAQVLEALGFSDAEETAAMIATRENAAEDAHEPFVPAISAAVRASLGLRFTSADFLVDPARFLALRAPSQCRAPECKTRRVALAPAEYARLTFGLLDVLDAYVRNHTGLPLQARRVRPSA